MEHLEIRQVKDPLDLRRLRSFMLKQPQFYPDYADWVDSTCLPRIESGTGRAYLLLVDGRVAGDVVFHLEQSDAVEIKNLRIDPEYRNRLAARFMLRQVELDAPRLSGLDDLPTRIITDVSTPNFSGVEFFLRSGFRIAGMEELYRPGQHEYLLEKLQISKSSPAIMLNS
jgi:N-acetylglutamate synthase-like GNAT family acetyltransferase